MAARHFGVMAGEPSFSSRLAQGLLTGVGFLGAGVIFRSGLNIHGLTTAASILTAASLGVIFGFGLYVEGAAALAAALVVLMVLRPFDKRMRRHGMAELSVRWAAARHLSETDFVTLLASFDVEAETIRHRFVDGQVEHVAQVRARGPMPTEALSQALMANPAVVGFDIEPRTV